MILLCYRLTFLMHFVTLFFKANDPSLFADFNDYYKYNHFLFNSGHIVNILQYLDTVRYHLTFYSKRRIIYYIFS